MDNHIIIERRNRYNDVIRFEKEDNTVKMTGMFEMGMRYGFANDYDTAYIVYMTNDSEKDKGLTREEFDRKMEVEYDFFNRYSKHVKTKDDVIEFVDPSGGPYIALGSNLAYYFQCEDNMIVNKIDVNEKEIIFSID
jgi:uncharacterized protein YnzC (UPF0291/DUF896 family)